LDIDAERQDFESIPLGLMFFAELHQIGDSTIHTNYAGEAPEVDQKPLPLEVRNLRVLGHTASIEDVPSRRFLAVMLGIIPGAGGLGSFDPLRNRRFERGKTQHAKVDLRNLTCQT